MKFTDRVYNVLKQIALIWLPAAATLYTTLAGLWGLHDLAQVVGSISAIDALLGTALHLSSSSYKAVSDGKIVVDKSDPAKDVYRLVLDTAVEDLEKKTAIRLDVTKPGDAV
jgi:hypothetical protein